MGQAKVPGDPAAAGDLKLQQLQRPQSTGDSGQLGHQQLILSRCSSAAADHNTERQRRKSNPSRGSQTQPQLPCHGTPQGAHATEPAPQILTSIASQPLQITGQAPHTSCSADPIPSPLDFREQHPASALPAQAGAGPAGRETPQRHGLKLVPIGPKESTAAAAGGPEQLHSSAGTCPKGPPAPAQTNSDAGTTLQHSVGTETDNTSRPAGPGGAHVSEPASPGEAAESRDPPSPGQSDVQSPEYTPELGSSGVIRLQLLQPWESKVLVVLVWVGVVATLAEFCWELAWKMQRNGYPAGSYRGDSVVKVNLVLGCLCLLCLGGLEAAFLWRLWLCKRAGVSWYHRGWRGMWICQLEGGAQLCNLALFMATNAVFLGASWERFNHAVRWLNLGMWTCWNTILLAQVIQMRSTNAWVPSGLLSCWLGSREQPVSVSWEQIMLQAPERGRKNGRSARRLVAAQKPLLMDAPIAYQWPNFILWILMELGALAACVVSARHQSTPGTKAFCGDGISASVCSVDSLILATVSLLVFWPFVYLVAYLAYMVISLRSLRKLSWIQHRVSGQIVRLTMRLRLPFFIIFLLSITCLFYVRYDTFRTFEVTWLGLTPLYLAQSFSCSCWLWLLMPLDPRQNPNPLVPLLLAEWSWSKARLPQDVARRNARPGGSGIAHEPMFCFETCAKCLLWAELVYQSDATEAVAGRVSLEEAMAMSGLHKSEVFWDRASDTKMLMAWSKTTLICAFRGTGSWANACSDIQTWRVRHLPVRRTKGGTPKVHSGFYKAWRRNGFDETVSQRMEALMDEKEVDLENLTIYITGHSLGGALAELAAHSFMNRARTHPHSRGLSQAMHCYTFGAPRVGNCAWAAEYEGLVPSTFHVINDQDAVPRSGRFFGAFKRSCHRVVVNALGDLLVRPGPLAASMLQIPFGHSVRHHLTGTYRGSLVAILRAQGTQKGCEQGATAVAELMQSSPIVQRLMAEDELTRRPHMSKQSAVDDDVPV